MLLFFGQIDQGLDQWQYTIEPKAVPPLTKLTKVSDLMSSSDDKPIGIALGCNKICVFVILTSILCTFVDCDRVIDIALLSMI